MAMSSPSRGHEISKLFTPPNMKRFLLLCLFLAGLACGATPAHGDAVYTDVLPDGSDDYCVFWVGKGNDNSKLWIATEAAFGEKVQLHIKDLWKWWKRCKERNLIGQDVSLERFCNSLVLIANGVPLTDLTSERVTEWVPSFPYHTPLDPDSEREGKPNANTPEMKAKAEAVWKEWNDRLEKWQAKTQEIEEANKALAAKEKDLPADKRQPPAEIQPFDGTYYTIQFTLRRTDINQPQWARILNKPGMADWRVARRLQISVALPRNDGGYSEMVSWVRFNGVASKDLPRNNFTLVVAGTRMVVGGTTFLALSILALLGMLRSPGLLRESAAPLRPDGLQPFSLSRMQMAFWLYLIVPAYVLLWLVLGRTDVLNNTASILLGITSITAMGAGLLSGGTDNQRRADVLTEDDIDVLHPTLAARLLDRRIPWSTKTRIARRITELTTARDDPNATVEQKGRLQARIDALRAAGEYLEKPAPIRFLLDLVSEKGMPNFAKFQMLVWTTVLGVVFWTEVYLKLVMPDFDAAVLALLGISAGTYLGFKGHATPPPPPAGDAAH